MITLQAIFIQIFIMIIMIRLDIVVWWQKVTKLRLISGVHVHYNLKCGPPCHHIKPDLYKSSNIAYNLIPK